jgi:AcrR family transcriptional regulator
MLTLLVSEAMVSTRVPRRASPARRRPVQARSQATVDAIVEAAAHILGQFGWLGFTTNAVAERAGVSIGSLYQYFPDKLAILNAVRQRHLDECLAAVLGCNPASASVDEFAEKLVDALIAVHRIFPGLHRVLLDQAPTPADYLDPASPYEVEYLACFERAVAAYAPRGSTRETAMVLSDTMDGVIHNATRRGMLDVNSVRSELVRVVRFLLQS